VGHLYPGGLPPGQPEHRGETTEGKTKSTYDGHGTLTKATNESSRPPKPRGEYGGRTDTHADPIASGSGEGTVTMPPPLGDLSVDRKGANPENLEEYGNSKHTPLCSDASTLRHQLQDEMTEHSARNCRNAKCAE
jgi:hypothetical protein